VHVARGVPRHTERVRCWRRSWGSQGLISFLRSKLSSEKRTRIDYDASRSSSTTRYESTDRSRAADRHRRIRIVGYLTQITGHSPPLRPVMSVIVIPYVNAKYETMVISLNFHWCTSWLSSEKNGFTRVKLPYRSNGVIWRTWACTERTRRATVHNAPRASSLAGSDERRVL
jgi:hypothetical protein